MSNSVIARHFTVSQTVIQASFLIFSFRERIRFLLFVFVLLHVQFSLFFFQTKPTDDRGDDAPSRQKKNERRVPQRRKTTTEANITITNKRVSHRLDRRWPISERHVKPASPPAESEGLSPMESWKVQ